MGKPRRGRPRSEAAEQAIIEAVLDLLEQGGSLSELTIEGIARSAGVGKATIYRRWPGKEALLVDVLAALDQPEPRIAGRSVRDDLIALVESIRLRGVTRRDSALLRVVMTEVHRHPALYRRQYHDRVVEQRRRLLRQVLRRGVASGELRGDIDLRLLMELFTGPMLARTLLHDWEPLEEGLAEQIVDAVLTGVRPR